MRPPSFASPARTHGTRRKRRRNEADLPVTGGGQAGITPLNLRFQNIYNIYIINLVTDSLLDCHWIANRLLDLLPIDLLWPARLGFRRICASDKVDSGPSARFVPVDGSSTLSEAQLRRAHRAWKCHQQEFNRRFNRQFNAIL